MIILDNDLIGLFLSGENDALALLKRRLDSGPSGRLRLYYGGTLLSEYVKNLRWAALLSAWSSAGLAILVCDDDIRKTKETIDLRQCKSNSEDHDTLAIAVFGSVRLLATGDVSLSQDFKDARLVPCPPRRQVALISHSSLGNPQAPARARPRGQITRKRLETLLRELE